MGSSLLPRYERQAPLWDTSALPEEACYACMRTTLEITFIREAGSSLALTASMPLRNFMAEGACVSRPHCTLQAGCTAC